MEGNERKRKKREKERKRKKKGVLLRLVSIFIAH